MRHARSVRPTPDGEAAPTGDRGRRSTPTRRSEGTRSLVLRAPGRPMVRGARSPYRGGMTGLRIRLRRLARTELGAVATEYGLVLTLVALTIIVAVGLFGDELVSLFESGTGGFPVP